MGSRPSSIEFFFYNEGSSYPAGPCLCTGPGVVQVKKIMNQPAQEKPIEKIQEAAETVAQAETAAPHERHYRTLIFRSGLLIEVLAFIVLSVIVSTNLFTAIDLSLTRSIQMANTPLLNSLMVAISWPGFLPQSILIIAVASGALYLFGLHWEALVSVGGAVFSESINALAKLIIHRPRPAADLVHVFTTLDSYSFPSGHVMFYTAFFGFLWFLAFTLLRKSVLRIFLLVVFGVLILTIGVSRVFLGEHWTSDVVGAYLLGSLVLASIVLVYQWGKQRFFKRQPVAPD